MEIEEFKKEWKNIKTPQIDLARLKDMIIEKSHPVLSGIRKQLTLELIGWSAFLIICFTGLDADQKPILTNVILIISVTLPMIFNIYGYRLSKELIEGPDISSSLQNRIYSLRRFAIVCVLLRIMLIIGVGYFFVSTINIDHSKLMLLGAGSVFLIFPLYFLVRIWTKRLRKLSDTLRLLKELG
jgi:predicted permease